MKILKQGKTEYKYSVFECSECGTVVRAESYEADRLYFCHHIKERIAEFICPHCRFVNRVRIKDFATRENLDDSGS